MALQGVPAMHAPDRGPGEIPGQDGRRQEQVRQDQGQVHHLQALQRQVHGGGQEEESVSPSALQRHPFRKTSRSHLGQQAQALVFQPRTRAGLHGRGRMPEQGRPRYSHSKVYGCRTQGRLVRVHARRELPQVLTLRPRGPPGLKKNQVIKKILQLKNHFFFSPGGPRGLSVFRALSARGSCVQPDCRPGLR